ATLGLGAVIGGAKPAHAQSEPFIGQMAIMPYTFCPRNWAAAEGQLLAISQNTALFSLLGTAFGGDGRTTFALPDMRGRAPIGLGAGPGLTPSNNQGAKGGSETHTMTVAQMPSHNHMVNANNGANGFADRKGPANDFLGSPHVNNPTNPAEDLYIYADQAPNVQMDSRMIEHTGGSQSFNIRNPYIVMRWCIALQGIYPSRS
ncbi:MAG: tail fiber protein, partial [Pseudomonadota bacterium]